MDWSLVEKGPSPFAHDALSDSPQLIHAWIYRGLIFSVIWNDSTNLKLRFFNEFEIINTHRWAWYVSPRRRCGIFIVNAYAPLADFVRYIEHIVFQGVLLFAELCTNFVFFFSILSSFQIIYRYLLAHYLVLNLKRDTLRHGPFTHTLAKSKSHHK